MLRISRSHDETLRLEGRLTRYEVGLLRETLRAGPNGTRAVDLADLAFVDEAGAAVLSDLRSRGLELRGGSAYVRQLLQEVKP
jgi:ABC-type transporter Mla MlaB component